MPATEFLVNFDRDGDQLMAFAAFCILTPNISARKAFLAASAALCSDETGGKKPRAAILDLKEKGLLPAALKSAGYRFYNTKAECLASLAQSPADLRHGSFDELLAIKGFSFKTLPFFLTYSRENSEWFVPDIHVMRAMDKEGCPHIRKNPAGEILPPESRAYYTKLNEYFNEMARERGLTVRELDYSIWSQLALGDENRTMADILGRKLTRREIETFGIGPSAL
jgi:thermostable 8-oxoguanine DNA glycosylase